MNRFLIYAFLISLIACTQNNSNLYYEVINIPEETSYDFIKSIKSIECFQIEESEDSFFEIPWQFEVTDDEVFIMDKRIGKVLVYDKKGEFKRALSHLGRGPGEYTGIHSFCIDGKNNEIIISDFDENIRIYDINDCSFKSKIDRTIGYAIIKHKDLFYGFNYLEDIESQSHITCSDSLFNVQKDFLPIEYENGYIMPPSYRFFKWNNSLYTFLPYTDKIYRVNQDECRVAYKMNFGIGKMIEMEQLQKIPSQDNYIYYLREEEFILQVNPLMNNNWIIINYYHGIQPYSGAYNIKEDKCYNLKITKDNSTRLFRYIQFDSDGYLWSVVNNIELENISKLGEINPVFNALIPYSESDEDRNILIKIEL